MSAPLEEIDTNAHFVLRNSSLAMLSKAVFSALNYVSSILYLFYFLSTTPTVIFLIFFIKIDLLYFT